MAVSTKWYLTQLKNQYDGTNVVDWDTDTIKVALLSSAHTPDTDTHDFFNDVSANEISGTGYTAGGVALTTKTVNKDTTADKVQLRADDPSWAGATFTARYAVIYKDTGTPSTSPLLALVDLDANQSVTSGTFTLDFSSTDGLLRLGN